MQSADVKIMIFIDGDDSSLKAIRFGTRMALDHKAKGSTVAVVLVNLYSSWDVSGNEERDGRLMMDQAESFAESSGLTEVVVVTESSNSIKNDSIEMITQNSIDYVIIGESSYQGSSDPDNWVSNTWNAIVNALTTPLPQYLFKNASCQVVLVKTDGSVVKNSTL
jgi:K+-sensing histidine kinase KdpD